MNDSAPKLLINAVVISILILLQAAPVSAATLETNETTQGLANTEEVLANKIVGHIYQLDGVTPISGALVTAYNLDFQYVTSSPSLDNGSYNLTSLPAGFYYISAQAATYGTIYYGGGYDNIYAVNVQVRNNQDTSGIDFILLPEATLSGHVFQSVGNIPIPEALVQVTPLYGGPTHQANSDGTGSFTVGGLASGFYVVSASATGFEQEFFDNAISADAAEAIQLVQPYNKTDVNFTLSVPTLDTPTERPYLIGFYNDNDGTHWYNQSGWDTTDNTCTWYGVACHDGHVAVINLDGNQVSGPISPNLWSLPGLQVLSLQNNQLSGGVPTGLVNLTELRFLNLGNNQLTGAIPTVLAGLTRLGALMLNNNQLGGSIPNTFQNLAKLRTLLLNNNNLTDVIPSEFGYFVALRVLALQNNQLSGGIPSTLGSLNYLTDLDLRNNQLSGVIPGELGNITSLVRLYLNSNQFTGNIPASLGNLANLRELNLSLNQLTGSIPASLGACTRLEKLYLNLNQLTGPIPASFSGLSADLQNLYLENNQLSGSILPELGSLTNLMYLGLSHNLLSGAIPETLGNLTSLTILRMDHNHLAGDIPASLANLTSLVNPGQAWVDHGDGLDLSYNRLNVLNYPDPLGTFLQQKDPNWYLSQSRLIYLPMVKK